MGFRYFQFISFVEIHQEKTLYRCHCLHVCNKYKMYLDQPSGHQVIRIHIIVTINIQNPPRKAFKYCSSNKTSQARRFSFQVPFRFVFVTFVFYYTGIYLYYIIRYWYACLCRTVPYGAGVYYNCKVGSGDGNVCFPRVIWLSLPRRTINILLYCGFMSCLEVYAE